MGALPNFSQTTKVGSHTRATEATRFIHQSPPRVGADSSLDSSPGSKFQWTAATVVESLLRPSQVIAEWHGQVLYIAADHFVAELRGTIGTGVAGTTEEATIPLDEVQPDDLALLSPGAFFRLCVNLEYKNGTRRRFTDVVFRRMPAYRREELEAARQEALDLARDLRVE